MIVDSWSTRRLLSLFTVFACPCACIPQFFLSLPDPQLQLLSGDRFLAHLRRGVGYHLAIPTGRSMPQPLVIWLLLLAAAAARTAAGPETHCIVGIGSEECLALGSYYILPNQNLTYISSLFGINDYFTLLPYNPAYGPNLDYIAAGNRINVYIRCRCLAIPSSNLGGSFPYWVSQGETYASVAALYHNLTTANLLQPAPGSSVNDVLDAGTVVNVTVTCSCLNTDAWPDYRYSFMLTYPLGDGETPDSIAANYGLSSQAELDLFRSYNPRLDSVKEGDVVYIPLKDGFYNGRIVTPSTGRRKIKKVIIISVAAGTSGLFGAGIILVLFLLWYKKYYGMLPWQSWSRNAPRIESFLQKQETSHPKRYSYQDVRRMTKSFADKLGQGGYGAVYRGNLADGREIAVKTLKDTEGDGEDFMNEVASISRTSHVNIVTFLGFCLQGRKRALIYEYMPNGSLERYTFGSMSAEGDNSLCWDKLFEIVIGIARGLEYLHNGCNTRIVHFDIKPQNILLDQNFCPKISDFGLAKLCQQKQSKISMVGMRGTIGYIAPEVFNRSYGAVSNKSDVYSYGMMVLEMVGARKQIDVGIDTSSNYFPQWLYDKLDQFCVATISEIGSDTTELVRKMVIVGLWCIQLRPIDRPSMSKVLEMLESNTLDLQLPPKAFWTG